MKSHEFAKLLESFCGVVDSAEKRALLQELAGAFARAGSATTAAAVRRFDKAPETSGSMTCAAAASALEPFRAVIAAVGKATLAKEIDSVAQLLRRKSSASIDSLSATPLTLPKTAAKRESSAATASQPELVDAYVRQLKSATGDEYGFSGIYRALSEDDRLSVRDLTSVAKLFTGATVRSRSDALRKINARQERALLGNAKARATAGRSAA